MADVAGPGGQTAVAESAVVAFGRKAVGVAMTGGYLEHRWHDYLAAGVASAPPPPRAASGDAAELHVLTLDRVMQYPQLVLTILPS